MIYDVNLAAVRQAAMRIAAENNSNSFSRGDLEGKLNDRGHNISSFMVSKALRQLFEKGIIGYPTHLKTGDQVYSFRPFSATQLTLSLIRNSLNK